MLLKGEGERGKGQSGREMTGRGDKEEDAH